jgi:hypothetical protein
MIAIRSIDSYRDGGTLSIKCHFGFTSKDGKIDIRTHETEICIDKRMRGKGDGSIWMGYPGKETSQKIVNEEMLEYILKRVENHFKWQTTCFESAINAIKLNITEEEEDL